MPRAPVTIAGPPDTIRGMTSEQTPTAALLAKARSLDDTVQGILDNPRIDEELKRKLRYCVDQLKIRQGDGFLASRRRELIHEAQRRPFGV